MKQLLLCMVLVAGALYGEEDYEIEDVDTEEAQDVCVPDEPCDEVSHRSRRLLFRRHDNRYLRDMEREPIWPGKTENSFIEAIQQ